MYKEESTNPKLANLRFPAIKKILDDGISAWAAQNGPPDLSGHGPTFSWKTKPELLAATGHGKRLIQPEVIGNGKGNQANLIIDLRIGFPGSGRMPLGGPFIADAQIQEIEDWINDGCPD
jgi:hypothetical protein